MAWHSRVHTPLDVWSLQQLLLASIRGWAPEIPAPHWALPKAVSKQPSTVLSALLWASASHWVTQPPHWVWSLPAKPSASSCGPSTGSMVAFSTAQSPKN